MNLAAVRPGESGPPHPSSIVRNVVIDVAWNTVVPVVLYEVARRWLGMGEFGALVVATLFPVGESLYGLGRYRSLDPIALVVLFGIAFDAGAIFLGGSPKLLLIRESAFTGAFGAACFVSLLVGRPLMYYFGRFFMAGHDPVKRRKYDESWNLREVRSSSRLITVVWGVVFVGELALRIVFVHTFSVATVLIISPAVLGVLTVATIIWSLRYAHRIRERVLPLLG